MLADDSEASQASRCAKSGRPRLSSQSFCIYPYTTIPIKLIKAYVRPALVDHVIDMIEEQSTDSPGIAGFEVRVYGHPDDTDPLECSHLAKLEIVVRDEQVEGVVGMTAENLEAIEVSFTECDQERIDELTKPAPNYPKWMIQF